MSWEYHLHFFDGQGLPQATSFTPSGQGTLKSGTIDRTACSEVSIHKNGCVTELSMRVKSGIGQHSYTIETPKSGVPGGTSVIVTRLTLTEAGWVRTGRMTFPNHAEALARVIYESTGANLALTLVPLIQRQ